MQVIFFLLILVFVHRVEEIRAILNCAVGEDKCNHLFWMHFVSWVCALLHVHTDDVCILSVKIYGMYCYLVHQEQGLIQDFLSK